MIEFRTVDNSPVEIDDTYTEVWAHFSKRLLTNGHHAVEVWRLRRREKLLAAYEEQQQQKATAQKTDTSVASIRKTDEATCIAAAQTVHETNTQVVDEEAEAQEFADAVADPVEVDPNDWFECKLKYRLPAPQPILIGEFESGQTIYIYEREVTRCPAHSLCLPPGTPFYVRMELNKRPDGRLRRSQYRAIEARIDGAPTKLHERGTISNWQGSYGGGRMECGCNIFLRSRDAHESLYLHVGDRVEFDLTYSEKKRAWIGTNIVKAQNNEAPR